MLVVVTSALLDKQIFPAVGGRHRCNGRQSPQKLITFKVTPSQTLGVFCSFFKIFFFERRAQHNGDQGSSGFIDFAGGRAEGATFLTFP